MKRVVLDGRTFFVKFDGAGKPLLIKERKLYQPGTCMECWYNAPYWHHSMNLGGPSSMPARIIAAAQQT